MRETEMAILSSALRILLPIAYGALAFYFARTFFRRFNQAARLKHAVPAAYALLALHTIYIGAYTAANHHDLVATVYELFSLIAFTLLAVYVFAELRASRETSGTGFFVLSVCFLLQLVSSLTISSAPLPETSAILKDPIFNLHVTTSVFGYAALMLAAIYGGLYLLLYRAIRRNQFGAIFEHIPSLERLERYGLRATAFGFIFLTLSVAFGALLFSRIPLTVSTSQFLLDPKVLMTLLVWLLFGVTLLVRKVVHLEGRRLVLFWMSGFALTVISMTIVNWIGTSFHSFL
ncbi:MAG TPA: cytochrome c biogenesis protein CcsA [Candidatus Kapabacteria bacterium]|nr:cytochrome c biogenesis protein CcsA [Candidatus Kapabacteria bacterium]